MSTETFQTNTDDARVPDNLPTMTKYEKHSWANAAYWFGFFIIMCVGYLLIFLGFGHQLIDALRFLMFGYMVGGVVIITHLRGEPTDTESRISLKTLNWTCLGVIFVCLLSAMFFISRPTVPKPSMVSLNTLGATMLCTIIIATAIRYGLLAYLLRKERLANTKSPHPNPLPEGEGITNH